jgi:spermidine synthase
VALPKRYLLAGRADAVVVCLSAASGAAALIYEIVWFQWVELIIGSSAVSLGVLLATFMGGMCVGSLMLPRVVVARRHPLRVYAVIELGIGVIGILLLLGMPGVSALYAGSALQGLPGLLLRALICAVLLLPPTVLMGATLPAIARWLEASALGISRLGTIYAANIGGAMFGCLLAGFYLLRLYDTATATYVAVATNAAVALGAAWLAAMVAHEPAREPPRADAAGKISGAWPVYVAIGLSGLTALGAEVTWTRILALLFGASVYTFSLILAVFLLGLGLGSRAGAYLVREARDPRTALGLSQLLLVLGIGWAALMIGRSLPYWPIYPPMAPSQWFNFQVDLVSCAVAVLPAALCWGASFPLAVAAIARGADAGAATAAVYAANTVGAIIGALAFSMLIFPALGPERAQQALIVCAGVAALVLLALPARAQAAAEPAAARRSPTFRAVAAAAAALLAALLAASVPDVPDKLIAYGRRMLLSEDAQVLYRGNGRVSSIAVTRLGETLSFHVSGKSEASTALSDLRLERMLGHIAALQHPKPRSVLIVGFGAGITAGTFTLYPDIERIVICEIEPLIPPHIGPYFTQQNYDVLHDPRVSIVYDDARHYMLTAKEKFDIITSDPIHPWVKGAAMLYTREYFELEKQRLNAGGVITQWVPLYESTTAAVKSEIATFFDVFPDGAAWSNEFRGRGSDVVMSARLPPAVLDIDALNERLDRPDHARVLASLREVKFSSATELLASFLGQRGELAAWLAGADINTDRNLRVQYLAGMGSNLESDYSIYEALRGALSRPPALFTGAPASMEALMREIGKQSRRLRTRMHQY